MIRVRRSPPKDSLEMAFNLDCKICMGQVVDAILIGIFLSLLL